MVYIGIDPGANGGIAVLREKRLGRNMDFICDKVDLYKYSDDNLIYILESDIDKINQIKVFLENVQGFPGRNAMTAVAQGKNGGKIVGILKAFRLEPTIVRPNVWKKHFSLINSKLTYKEKKQQDIARAQEIYPQVNLIPPGCKVPHDGMADALLIAEGGRQQCEEICTECS